MQEEKARRDAQEDDDEVSEKLDSGLRMDCKENVEVFGGYRSLESQHLRNEGTNPVSRRLER